MFICLSSEEMLRLLPGRSSVEIFSGTFPGVDVDDTDGTINGEYFGWRSVPG
jgi:hypothetical protein